MCSLIPEAWNIHTVIVMFQHDLFVHNVAALPHLAHHCALFTYYLANRQMVSYLLNSIFKLKEQTICNMCGIIPEAWNIHTVIVMFQHEFFFHSIAVLPRLARHCRAGK